MTEFDPVEFGREMGALIREAVGPLKSEIAELRSRQPEKGEKGDPGQDAPPVELDVSEVVKELLAADGVKQIVGLEVEAYMAENPPQAGKDGEPGAKGDPGMDGDKGMDGAGIADLLIDRDGNLTATFTDGRMKALGVVTGKDGSPGRDGKDGADLSALSAEFDDTGLTIHTAAGPIRKEFELPHDGGYWSENNRAHRKNAIVTHNGVAFIAKRNTTAEPKTENCDDWRILARKGRDGKDGRNGIDKTAPVKMSKPKKDEDEDA
jgi:hypothetical protein